MSLNARHRKTLNSIFADPVSGSIKWRDIESMLLALDFKISEGSGSRIKVVRGTAFAVFHRPHPSPDTDKGAIKAIRRFLVSAGVEP